MADYPNAYLVGRNLWLRALSPTDAEGGWHEWLSDEGVRRWLPRWEPNTVEKQIDFLQSAEKNPNALILGAFDKDQSKHIGIGSLRDINWVHGFADMAIIIGDTDARENSTYGLELSALMVKIAFMNLNLRNIRGGYMASNKKSQGILKALGFRDIGAFKDMFKIDNQLDDHVLVQLDRGSWLERNG